MATTILIGIGIWIGAAMTLELMFSTCEVKTKKTWAEHYLAMNALYMRVHKLEVEKGRLRLALGAALGAGEMTEDGKKIAKTVWQALNAVIESKQFSEPKPSEGEQPRLSSGGGA